MSEIIREFYKKNGFPERLIEHKVQSICKYPDIVEEFEEWIRTGTFREDRAVTIEGYTAKRLSEISAFLNGDGAFTVLKELRENPEGTLMSIAEGFVWK